MDARYHGRRATPNVDDARAGYQDAIFRAWLTRDQRPFLLDNIADLRQILDLLESRPDVDASRIGMAGLSLGGMHTWLCAALDTRIAVAAPVIGVGALLTSRLLSTTAAASRPPT